MARHERQKRLIVNADDFGRSKSINEAVVRAHREGILTTASLMVNGEAFDDAVDFAKQNPALGVGLHLTLVCGTSALGRGEIPGLVDDASCFGSAPIRTGCRYFFNRDLKPQLEAEVNAQFRKFHETGLTLDHVDGHLHMHLHPTVFGILERNAERWKIRHLRLTKDPLFLSFHLASGAWVYRLTHALIYSILVARVRSSLRGRGIRHSDTVFGLLQSGRVDETYVLKLLPKLPSGDSELYSHPSLDEFRHEFEALISPRVKLLLSRLGILPIRYQDL